MDVRNRVEMSLEKMKTTAEELRQAAVDTENEQAKNVFQQSAEKTDECVKQVQMALNQFK